MPGRGRIRMEIPLVITGEPYVAAYVPAELLFYQAVCQAAFLGKHIVLVVVAIEGVEVTVFSALGLVERAAVRMAVVDHHAITGDEEGGFGERFRIGRLPIHQNIVRMVIFILVDGGIVGGKASAIEL